jgi:glycosyltransferase involved in cell wall biosynthesis
MAKYDFSSQSRQEIALNIHPGSAQPLCVVHVSFGLDVGGQEKLLVEFARHVDRRMIAQTFVSLGTRGTLARDLETCGCRVVAMDEPSGLKPSLILRLAHLFHRRRAAVVHTHDSRSLFYAVPAARLARVLRAVHTCHGRDVIATPRQVAMARHLSRLVDRYVCVSREVKAQCREQGITGPRVCTILNGIDIGRFPYGGPSRDGPVVTVARLSPEKDVANLVRATAVAARQRDEFRVEVAGGGSCLDDLKGLATELGVAERVTFLGEVRDIPALLGRARMFVQPSLSEGIPLTVLEAMARGLPVVATRVGGLPEVVVDGETGFLVPAADPPALAQAVLTLWCNPDVAERMGYAGRRRAEECFDVRRMVTEYEALDRKEETPTDRWLDAGANGPRTAPAELRYIAE